MVELDWDGKYTDGKKARPLRIELPFQPVEIINEKTQERQLALDAFYSGFSSKDWRNRLVWGDKKYVLPSLFPEFAGKVQLIYIDPPFDINTNFSIVTRIPETEESFAKQPNIIEERAYRNTWGRGRDGYLQWFYETIASLRELLSEDGSIYVHCDWHMNSVIRLILDEVFGASCHGNEIIWHYHSGGRQEDRYSRKHDTIFLYNHSEKWIFNADMVGELRGQAKRNNMRKGIDEDGRAYFSIKVAGKTYKYYENERLTPPDVWTDISHIHQTDPQRVGYPTQKPEALLHRIIEASSNEGDIVLDCFCGSGTTAVVAEKLNRRWIACDLRRFAVHTTRKRLLSLPNVKPFLIQNLGKYERHLWQITESSNSAQQADIQRRYRNFILQLYHATPLIDYIWLHGIKEGRFLHIGSVDAPVALGEVKSVVNEFWRAKGKEGGKHNNGIDILGWDFAFDLNETARQMAADAHIHLVFKKIPREVLDRRAVEQGDIFFYELAALEVEVAHQGKSINIELRNFFVSPDDVPEEVRRAITRWSQWIDYWAVDWDYREDTFHNQWQTYRTKQSPKLTLKASHEYNVAGIYTVVIKAIDIFGNDTTKSIVVDIR